jgi:hypothetical protein
MAIHLFLAEGSTSHVKALILSEIVQIDPEQLLRFDRLPCRGMAFFR